MGATWKLWIHFFFFLQGGVEVKCMVLYLHFIFFLWCFRNASVISSLSFFFLS